MSVPTARPARPPHASPPDAPTAPPRPPSGAGAPTTPDGRPPTLRVVPDTAVDVDAAEAAAARFLTALGVDVGADGVRRTPRRMALAWAELLEPRAFDLTTFPNDEGYDELVLARSVPVRSMCEHHMLPFVGVAHVGYLPGDRIVGLSKLARVVELFARRPQVQERLTRQVADWLQAELAPRGVGVVVEAEHQCMSLRGVQAAGTTTVTSAVHGALREDPRSRAEFFDLVRAPGSRS